MIAIANPARSLYQSMLPRTDLRIAHQFMAMGEAVAGAEQMDL